MRVHEDPAAPTSTQADLRVAARHVKRQSSRAVARQLADIGRRSVVGSPARPSHSCMVPSIVSRREGRRPFGDLPSVAPAAPAMQARLASNRVPEVVNVDDAREISPNARPDWPPCSRHGRSRHGGVFHGREKIYVFPGCRAPCAPSSGHAVLPVQVEESAGGGLGNRQVTIVINLFR
jgi:hypothetical protein